jgi:hypothetical protein
LLLCLIIFHSVAKKTIFRKKYWERYLFSLHPPRYARHLKTLTLQIIGKIIIYLGINPGMKDNAMGGGRDGATRQASLEPLIIWR